MRRLPGGMPLRSDASEVLTRRQSVGKAIVARMGRDDLVGSIERQNARQSAVPLFTGRPCFVDYD